MNNLANTERHIGQTKVRLTPRGKFVFGTLGAIAVLLAVSAFNTNVLTPEECRDGLFNIKQTDVCFKYYIGAP